MQKCHKMWSLCEKTPGWSLRKKTKRESLPFPRKLKKKALLFPSCEKRNWKKSVFFSQKMCNFFLFYKWKIMFFSCEKRNWKKSLFFFHVRREIEKNFFPSLMWKGKGSGISSLFSSLKNHPEKHETNKCNKNEIKITYKYINCEQTEHQIWARMCSVKQKKVKRIKKLYNINSVFYSIVVKNFTVLTKQSNKMIVLNDLVSKNSRIEIQISQQ